VACSDVLSAVGYTDVHRLCGFAEASSVVSIWFDFPREGALTGYR
jgi:hypothetical protein